MTAAIGLVLFVAVAAFLLGLPGISRMPRGIGTRRARHPFKVPGPRLTQAPLLDDRSMFDDSDVGRIPPLRRRRPRRGPPR